MIPLLIPSDHYTILIKLIYKRVFHFATIFHPFFISELIFWLCLELLCFSCFSIKLGCIKIKENFLLFSIHFSLILFGEKFFIRKNGANEQRRKRKKWHEKSKSDWRKIYIFWNLCRPTNQPKLFQSNRIIQTLFRKVFRTFENHIIHNTQTVKQTGDRQFS